MKNLPVYLFALGACLAIGIKQCNAASFDNEIKQSCYQQVADADRAENCVVLNKEAAKYLTMFTIANGGTEATQKVILECSKTMPYKSDFMYIKACFTMYLHQGIYGGDK